MKRIIVGFFAVIGFLVIALIVIGVTISVRSNKKQAQLPERMVLSLSLQNGLNEAASDHGVLSSFENAEPNLQDIIQTLELARQDARVTGLALHLSAGGIGLSTAQELRDAVFRFRRSGKFAYIYADTLGDGPAMPEYWLATAFEQIWLQPLGELAITGFSTEMPFAKELLDKIGVKANLLHQGRYKSFPEMATRSSISEDNRAMTLSLLQDLQQQFDKDVTRARHLDEKTLQTA
ncbi:MAG: sppA, partial [Alphaproteobacteria bacterium]|nr:sppA [Alphaproteobacteria bacterium]